MKLDKFYVNKNGEPAEHVSARGGIYKVRWSNWKAIKQCQSTDEIRVLIGKFKSEMKGLDKDEDCEMIREWRTTIIMADDWYDYLKYKEDSDGKFSSGWGPLTNTVQDTKKIFDSEQLEEDIDEEGSAINKDDENPDSMIQKPKKQSGIERPRNKVDSAIGGYYQHGVVVGEAKWYNKQVQQRVQEIFDRDVRNRLEKRKTDPHLTSVYYGWRYDKEIKKKKKKCGG